MNPTPTVAAGPQPASSIRDLARCLACGASLRGESSCPRCGRAYPCSDGILEAIGPLSGRNRIVAAFYDGPGWKRFRPWEQGFLILQGGARKARMEILRHLLIPGRDPARGLEVGIGDGANLDVLPPGWVVHGVDIARTQLQACLRRHPEMTGRLAWAEAECLPFDDATFDACWSIGGFTYYRDHEAALREMCRVTRPGGPVVVADEIPGLHRAGLGHLLGVPSFDAWWLRRLGLDREFVQMVLAFDVDLEAVRTRVWPESSRHRIWHGLGYCFVNT
ncbi:MAG TPA: class I SAM-dependent methyltransferase [Isosphaeraceae bacterium]|nr:class I SAM-dependent methyltransferase [Isosphaeraceae bacterium]